MLLQCQLYGRGQRATRPFINILTKLRRLLTRLRYVSITHEDIACADVSFKAQFDGNTTNDACSIGDVISISNWEITEDILSTFKDILNLPYPYPLMDEKLQPLRKWHNNCQQCPFRHETCLTGRLQSTVFEDLSRVLKYISSVVAAERSKGKELFPNSSYTPLLTECGSCAKNYDSFLPDRCSYPACLDVARDRPPVTRCPGEIKPSYKFRGHWATKDQLYPGDHDLKPILEYRKVLAQLKFYIRYMGQYNEDEDGAYTEPDISLTRKAGRYGYVITDEEVVLVSCEPHQVTRGLRLTPGFPLCPSAAVRPIFSDSEDNERHNQEAAYDAESDTDHSNADYPSSDDGQDQ